MYFVEVLRCTKLILLKAPTVVIVDSQDFLYIWTQYRRNSFCKRLREEE